MAAAMRIAGVGAGYFSQFHLEAWKAIDGVDYVALCDTDRNKAEQLALEALGRSEDFR